MYVKAVKTDMAGKLEEGSKMICRGVTNFLDPLTRVTYFVAAPLIE